MLRRQRQTATGSKGSLSFFPFPPAPLPLVSQQIKLRGNRFCVVETKAMVIVSLAHHFFYVTTRKTLGDFLFHFFSTHDFLPNSITVAAPACRWLPLLLLLLQLPCFFYGRAGRRARGGPARGAREKILTPSL